MERRRLYACKLCFEYFREKSKVCFFRCGHTMCIDCVIKVIEKKNISCHPCERRFLISKSVPQRARYDLEKKTQRSDFVHAYVMQNYNEPSNLRNLADGYGECLEACANAEELQCLKTGSGVNKMTNVVPGEKINYIQNLETPSRVDDLTNLKVSVEVTEEQNLYDSAKFYDINVFQQDTKVHCSRTIRAGVELGSTHNFGTNSSCGIMQRPKIREEDGNIDKLESHAKYFTQTSGSNNYNLEVHLQEQEEYLKANISQQENTLQKIRRLYFHHESILKESKDKLQNVRTMKKKPLEYGWKKEQSRQERPNTTTPLLPQQTEWRKTKEIQMEQREWKSITELKNKRDQTKMLKDQPRRISEVETHQRETVTSSVHVNVEHSNSCSMVIEYGTFASGTPNSRDEKVTFSQKVKSFIHRMDYWVMKLLSGKLISVASSTGQSKTATLSLWKGKVYLHHLQDRQAHSSCHHVQHSQLMAFLEESSTVAFLDLASGGSFRGRVHILLSSGNPLARNFRMLCTGEQGPSYAHTKFFAVWGWSHWDERIVGGDYEYNDGTGGAAVVEDVNNADGMRYHNRCETGTVLASAKRDSKFSIVTGPGGATDNILIIGKVMDNFDVLKAAAKQLRDKIDVEIIDCGVVLPL